jgi:acyl-CoA reductase-like NAD-dependent aldehyde dehydrogenase
MGDPMSTDTQVGPITTPPQYKKVLDYIDIARGEGAKAALGGAKAAEFGEGYFVQPTIFTGVNNSMRIAQEEVFGPVLSVIPFEDDEDAIAIGNGVVYGLAAGVWTRDISKAHKLAALLRAGSVYINTWGAGDPAAPFGGYKASGIGREKGHHNLDAYLETKAVFTQL